MVAGDCVIEVAPSEQTSALFSRYGMRVTGPPL